MALNSPYMNVMIKATEKAARSLTRDFGEVENLQVSQKGPGDFVSAADKRAEEIIHEELSKGYAKFDFLMEESGEHKGSDGEYRWIVDPLDGTTNFLHGIPHWCITIALERRGEIVCGLIHDPVKDEMFTAEKSQGAFHRRQRLRVSGRSDPRMSVVLTGAPRRNAFETFMKEYGAVCKEGMILRRFGAAALDLAYVAMGRAEGFWERDLKPWDVAAGSLIIKEAGGFVADIDDHKANPVETGNIVAGNEAIFQILKKTLKDA